MSRRVRGRAVIINNMYFVNASPRDGSEKDVVDLKKLFEAIHFEVILHENKSAQVRSLCHFVFSREGNTGRFI